MKQKTILIQLCPRRVMSRGIRSVSTAEPGAATHVTHVTSHFDNAHWAAAALVCTGSCHDLPQPDPMSNSPIPSPYRCAVPTMRRILLCRNSSSKCATRWPMWRGECYPPPCCSTAAGWAQSTLWYPTFKSRPFSLFVWHASPFLSLHCLKGN